MDLCARQRYQIRPSAYPFVPCTGLSDTEESTQKWAATIAFLALQTTNYNETLAQVQIAVAALCSLDLENLSQQAAIPLTPPVKSSLNAMFGVPHKSSCPPSCAHATCRGSRLSSISTTTQEAGVHWSSLLHGTC